MDIELTRSTSDSSHRQTACADRQDGSFPPPGRARRSDHQGTRSGFARIGRIRATTVVALRTGGASQSKWARRSRPWNASTPTAVVASLGEVFERTIFKDVLRFASAGDEAGRSRGRSLRPSCPKGQPHQWPPVRSASGRGAQEAETSTNAIRPSRPADAGSRQIVATTRWIALQIRATSSAPVTKGGMV